MGRRGPKPKPTAIKKFEGNPGKRKLNKREPQPAAVDSIEPPADLSPIATEHWRILAPRLKQMGTLGSVDVGLFRIYCEAWQEKHDCEETLRSQGEYFTTESGFVCQHPAVNRLTKVLERIRKLGAEFGLSPSSRANLDVGGNAKPAGKLGKYVSDA